MTAVRLAHIVQTATTPRVTSLLLPVVLTATRALSPTVRLLRFAPLCGADAARQFSRLSAALPSDVDFSLPQGAPFLYEGGQWVDLLSPTVPQIGGFSFVSAPDAPASLLAAVDTAASGEFDLAVKVGRAPPAVWAHAARVGALAAVRVGGALTARTSLKSSDGSRWRHPRALLIAGGVGINPLYSIILELAATRARGGDVPHITLLASFSTVAEFIFRDELSALARGLLAGRLTVHATITRCEDARAVDGLERGRLTHARVAREVESGGGRGVAVVICGPPKMADDVVIAAKAAGVGGMDVSLERWW